MRDDYSHTDYVNAILRSVDQSCPYTDVERKRLYANGFLASFVASLATEDPIVYKKLKRLVDKKANNKAQIKR